MLHLFQILIVAVNGKCSWRRRFPATALFSAGSSRRRRHPRPPPGIRTAAAVRRAVFRHLSTFYGGIQYGENHSDLGNCTLRGASGGDEMCIRDRYLLLHSGPPGQIALKGLQIPVQDQLFGISHGFQHLKGPVRLPDLRRKVGVR